VRFGNNDFAVIAGYGDVVIGSMTIKEVHYVEGLGHNLFSVGQFCNKGLEVLEVAFRKSTCFVRNEDGVDLLIGDRSSNLYTIALNEVTSNSSTCLLAKASFLQSWLWRQLSKVDESSKKDLEDLFQDFYDEYFDSLKIMKPSTANVETPINEEVFHEVSESFQGESSSSSLNDDVQQSPEEDHPLHKIIGDPKSSVQTRGQVANSCLFLCLLSSIEPANVAEALRDVDWVSAMRK
nr:integrase, catalytic region, zinc finger, CCHC-type, peptidase aspartic, catalytic [Tanacetum cinerariifolium]